MKAAVFACLVAVVAALLTAHALWSEPGQASGSLTEVAESVAFGPHRVGEFVVELERGREGAPSTKRLSIRTGEHSNNLPRRG
jgi:hypothetical protein